MKVKLLYFLLFFATSIKFAFGEVPGSLTLDDIYVWGEDRSVMPYIGKDLEIAPYVRKFNFMSPLKTAYPSKIKNRYFPGSGLKISGGTGSFGEYLLRSAYENHQKNGWFYGGDLSGEREYINSSDLNYTDLSGTLKLGRNPWRLVLKGIFSDWQVSRDLLKVSAAGGAGVFFDTSFERVKIAEGSGEQYDVILKSNIPLYHNHHLSGSAEFSGLSVSRSEQHWYELNLAYLNTVFRDFSFLLSMGVRRQDKWKMIFRGVITGDIMDTGYRLYIRRGYDLPSMYAMYSTYRHLNISEFYYPSKKDSAGLIVIKNFVKAEASVDFSYSVIKDHIVIVDYPQGASLYNIRDHDRNKVEIFEIKTALEKNYFNLSYTYRHSDIELPYYNDEINFRFFPSFKSLFVNTLLNYRMKQNLFTDSSRSLKETINPYVELDLELGYNISESITVRMGGENLLSQKIVTIGDSNYPETVAKYYIILDIGFYR